MLKRTELPVAPWIHERPTSMPAARRDRVVEQIAQPAHAPRRLPHTGDPFEPAEGEAATGVILLIASSLFGLCIAVSVAVAGAGLLIAVLAYFGAAFTGLCVLLAITLLRKRSSDNEAGRMPADGSVDDEATATMEMIFKQNRRMRLRFWLVFGVVVSSVLITDHWAVLTGIVICSFAVLLWSLHSWQRAFATYETSRRN